MSTRIEGRRRPPMGSPRDRQIDPGQGEILEGLSGEILAAVAEITNRGGLILTPDQIDLLGQLAKIAAGLGLQAVTGQIDHVIALSDAYANMTGSTYPEHAVTYGATLRTSNR